ncbi:tumor protein p63-regulated gene 1 protein [Osmerus eperlanus]|uniref:tumor protein p63-regulated gene 1 protein n=1 Tax=Osmerus eperlanus TaxID=29151 RepID=UPI002E1009E3
MSEAEEDTFKAVELDQQAPGSASTDPTPVQPAAAEPSSPALQSPVTPSTESAGPAMPPSAQSKENQWTSAVNQFKLKRFFVLRPGTLDQAVEDVKGLVDQQVDGRVLSTWLLAEVDHWNNEKERLVLITEGSLLVCKYDFVMLNCDTIQRIPLNFVDRIAHGNFTFPPRSLISREGDGVRVFWDRLREPSFSSRWNPFSTDYPFSTFTSHPVRGNSDKLAALCHVQGFREQLAEAAREAHSKVPVPGKANGVLVLNQPLFIDATVGLMSIIGNQNKLGYCLARGNIGF